MKIISMWQPWCFFVARGWKTIETRTHQRFQSLAGRRIGIHAALKWDDNWESMAGPFMSKSAIYETQDFLRIGGGVICTVFAVNHRALIPEDQTKALIECHTPRWGLVLADVKTIPVVPMKGKQGIWNADIQE